MISLSYALYLESTSQIRLEEPGNNFIWCHASFLAHSVIEGDNLASLMLNYGRFGSRAVIPCWILFVSQNAKLLSLAIHSLATFYLTVSVNHMQQPARLVQQMESEWNPKSRDTARRKLCMPEINLKQVKENKHLKFWKIIFNFQVLFHEVPIWTDDPLGCLLWTDAQILM